MLKKIIFSLMLVFLSGTVAVNASSTFTRQRRAYKVDQSSKEALSKTILRGALAGDRELFWDLIDQESKQKISAAGQTKEDYLNTVSKQLNPDKLSSAMQMPKADAIKFFNAIMDQDADTIYAMLSQHKRAQLLKKAGSESAAKKMLAAELPTIEKNIIDAFIKIVGKGFIKHGNKWYFSYTPVAKKTPKAAIKQSTKQEVAANFLRAAASGNIDMLWQLMCFENKKKLLDHCKTESAAKKILKETFKPDPSMQAIFNDPAYSSTILKNAIETLDKKNAWVKSNGKLYIDLTKLE